MEEHRNGEKRKEQREIGKRLNIGETVMRLMKNRVAASRARSPVLALSYKFIHPAVAKKTVRVSGLIRSIAAVLHSDWLINQANN